MRSSDPIDGSQSSKEQSNSEPNSTDSDGDPSTNLSAALNKFFKVESPIARSEPTVPAVTGGTSMARYVDAIQYLSSLCEGKGHDIAVRDAGYSDETGLRVKEALLLQISRVTELGFSQNSEGVEVKDIGGHVRNRLQDLLVAAKGLRNKSEDAVTAFGKEVNGLFSRNVYPEKPRPYIELHNEEEFLLTLRGVCACVPKLDSISVELTHPKEHEPFTQVMSKQSVPSVPFEYFAEDITRWRIGFRNNKTGKSARTFLQLVVLTASLKAAVE
ncbi:MAG: hypothetical protein ACSHXK_14505 [Oceanococcus sp.]